MASASKESPFLENYLPYVLRRADQALSSGFYDVLNSYGIARSDWRVLAVLHELGELSILDLAAAALTPQPTVTQAVRRLEDRTLVSRVQGTEDKRQRFVSITSAGAALARTLVAEARQLESEALGQAFADRDQVHELIASLTALATRLDAQDRPIDRAG